MITEQRRGAAHVECGGGAFTTSLHESETSSHRFHTRANRCSFPSAIAVEKRWLVATALHMRCSAGTILLALLLVIRTVW